MHDQPLTVVRSWLPTLLCVALACSLTACGDGTDGATDVPGGQVEAGAGPSTNPFDNLGGGSTDLGAPDEGSFDESDGTLLDDGGEDGLEGEGGLAVNSLLPAILNHFDGEFDEAWLCTSTGTAGRDGRQVGYIFREVVNSATGYRIGVMLLGRTPTFTRGNINYANWIETGPDSLSIPISDAPHDIFSISFQDRGHWRGTTSDGVFGPASRARADHHRPKHGTGSWKSLHRRRFAKSLRCCKSCCGTSRLRHDQG